VAAVFPHAGFNWQYLAGSTAPFALLLGAEASARGLLAPLRRAAVWIVLVGSGVLAGLNAAHPGHEDYRAGVRVVLAQSEPGDGVVAADWQPAFFPHGLGLDYYFAREGVAPSRLRRIPVDGYRLDPRDLAGLERVVVLGRSLPNDIPLLVQLRARFASEDAHRVSRSIWVLVFEHPTGA
ncbi:MAG: hypothetical protein O7B99_03345, partial [Planctomycetota bacterium]|nr:hypothetical protein [Planctomycetota bacterium]